jgi:hypothetical protein
MNTSAPARNLYTGQLFQLSMRVAEIAKGDVLILSAKHHVLSPDQIVETYECEMPRTKSARADWAKKTSSMLVPFRTRPTIVLAGKFYADATVGFTNKKTPLAGLGIGHQLQYLKELTK